MNREMIPKIVSSSRPQLKSEKVIETLSGRNKFNRDLIQEGEGFKIAILANRGYYLHTMGNPEKNDRGIYDDAIWIYHDGGVASFNANVDPTIYRKDIANLKPGVWFYKRGIHGLSKPPELRYEALVQACEFTVIRDGNPPYEETGYFGINLHKGGNESTWSLGCQTIYSPQWDEFIETVKALTIRYQQHEIPYLLTDENLQV